MVFTTRLSGGSPRGTAGHNGLDKACTARLTAEGIRALTT